MNFDITDIVDRIENVDWFTSEMCDIQDLVYSDPPLLTIRGVDLPVSLYTIVALELCAVLNLMHERGDTWAGGWDHINEVRDIARHLKVWTQLMGRLYTAYADDEIDIHQYKTLMHALAAQYTKNLVLNDVGQTCIHIRGEDIYPVEDIYDLDYLDARALRSIAGVRIS
jgi:hypothetical protein